MEENKEGAAEKFFKDFGKKMDQFGKELKEAGSRAEVDLQKKYDELKAAAQKIKTEAQKKERWQEVEASLKKAGEDLENAFKAAFKKKD
ncbi:hypothetical protein WSM22_09450 [Cytophagales bacterium WSM2-2]|nr:hypothetical protein WSM22_09450 [Cytophagales bacterium WSM2-2]